MNIADRIQNLRKLRGISQEQLADQLGVSRQTISKWESEQSAPDMEKIILLSDYFEVTTDYLLKGIEKQEEGSPKPDARIFSLTGTTLGFLGIVISVAIWIERKTVAAVAIGLILTAMSVMIHQIGQILGGSNAAQARRQYWLLAPWYLVLIPYSCIFNFAQAIVQGFFPMIAPIPKLTNSLSAFAAGWLGYFLICLLTDAFLVTKNKIVHFLE